MTIIKNVSTQDLAQRNQLLQNCLRPEPLPYPIQSEYPIVLNPDCHDYSHCLYDEDRVIAHANLWPRYLVDDKGRTVAKIGLIGNVATNDEYRGRGIMSKLLTYLESKAILADMQALVLWSDLSKFYQKMGFESLSEEWHFHFKNKHASIRGLHEIKEGEDLSKDDLKRILDLRQSTPFTLKRNIEEFEELARIPNTLFLITRTKSGDIAGFCVIGKGYDMNGVIHEWGYDNIDELPDAINWLFKTFNFGEAILLAPVSISKSKAKFLKRFSSRQDKTGMCFGRILTNDEYVQRSLKNCFIWGLDSI